MIKQEQCTLHPLTGQKIMTHRLNPPHLVILAFLLVFLAGCTSNRSTVNQEPTKPFGSFTSVEVAEFQTELDTDDAHALAAALNDRIIKNLTFKHIRSDKEALFPDTTLQDDEKTSLLIEGTLIHWDDGNSFTRFMVGPFGGEAVAHINVKWTDESDNSVVADVDFECTLHGGSHGGVADKAIGRFLSEVRKYMKKHY